jgi:hypothetical protein
VPKASSKAQQRWWFAQARKKSSKITTKQAKAHARSGKAFKRLPGRKGRKR